MPAPAKTQAQHNQALFILALIMLVNAIAYGTIIPLLYPYAERFGINPIGLSILFAGFSLAQFIATPILGRLSDRFGRKPILLICIFGTSISLALFAMATNFLGLFLARLIDGVTGGNISVAQAVIADSTKGRDRAKAFGVLGAAFGFGFLAGPALGAFLSQYGLTVPFWFAAGLALVATVLGIFMLKETLPPEAKKAKFHHEPLFKFHALYRALFSPTIGSVLVMGFISAIALNAFIIGFQSFSVDVLELGTREIGLLFSMFGLITIVMQMAGLRVILKWFHSKKRIIMTSLILSAGILVMTALSHQLIPFAIALAFFGIACSPQNPLITSLLSERTKVEDQGGVLGINQSYTSLGQIVGPLVAGAIATKLNVPAVFIFAAGLYVLATLAGQWLYKPVKIKANI